MLLLSSVDFFQNYLFEKFFCVNHKSNGLDPDQDQYFVGPDLCQNCMQRLSADNKGRQ